MQRTPQWALEAALETWSDPKAKFHILISEAFLMSSVPWAISLHIHCFLETCYIYMNCDSDNHARWSISGLAKNFVPKPQKILRV